MILYDEKGNKINISTENKLGGRTHGNVYKISDTECVKIYKKPVEVDIAILKLIKELNLKKYYKILELYYTKKGNLSAIRTLYYIKENIDILTMDTDYTLDNLFGISSSINKLTQNNILVEDLHSENIIMNNSEITIIDTDLYSFNGFRTNRELEIKNIEKIAYIFKEVFIEAITDFHPEYKNLQTVELINKLFDFHTPYQMEQTYKKLTKHKYPIDYITHHKKSD